MFRYVLGYLYNSNDYLTPYGTFFANVLGSFLIGILAGYNLRTLHLNHQYQALLVVGFLGGFTTFSSFTFESMTMLNNGKFLLFFSYFFTTLILGMVGVMAGYFLSKYF